MSSRKESSTGPFLKKIRKSNNIQQQQLSALGSLPGVGEKTAKRMLSKFGTPVNVFNASLADLSKIEGLGSSRAKKIKNMLEKKSVHQKKSDQRTLHD
jgi:DNA excision repair protein ERCC-4